MYLGKVENTSENLISKRSLTILTMIKSIRVSSKGQIVIPEEMRNYLHIKEGAKLLVRESEGRLILESEETLIQALDKKEQHKEKMGWLILAEKNMAKLWDNTKDEKTWSKYL